MSLGELQQRHTMRACWTAVRHRAGVRCARSCHPSPPACAWRPPPGCRRGRARQTGRCRGCAPPALSGAWQAGQTHSLRHLRGHGGAQACHGACDAAKALLGAMYTAGTLQPINQAARLPCTPRMLPGTAGSAASASRAAYSDAHSSPARHRSMDRSRATVSCLMRPLPNSRSDCTTRHGCSPGASPSEPPLLLAASLPPAGVPLACRLWAALPGPRARCEASSRVPSAVEEAGGDAGCGVRDEQACVRATGVANRPLEPSHGRAPRPQSQHPT